MDDDELKELTADIKEKGVLVPLIIRRDNTILCGHNRLKASLDAGLSKIPVQTVVSKLTPEIEQEIMKSENDKRRGGNWSKQKKKDFIEKNFKNEIHKDNRGGDRKSQNQKFTEPSVAKKNLAKEISLKSKGKIPEGTAKRIVAEIKEEKKVPVKSNDKLFKKQYGAMTVSKRKNVVDKLIGDFIRNRKKRSVLWQKMMAMDAKSKEITDKLESVGEHSKLNKVLTRLRNLKNG